MGFVQKRVAHPELRKKRITPITCLKFSIVLREKKKIIGMRERKITWYGMVERV